MFWEQTVLLEGFGWYFSPLEPDANVFANPDPGNRNIANSTYPDPDPKHRQNT